MDENNMVTMEEATLENMVEVPFEDTPVVTTETEELVETPAVVDEAPVATNNDDSLSWKDSVELGAKVGVYCGTAVITTFGIMKAAEWVGNKIGNFINKRSEKKEAAKAEKAKQQEELNRLANMTPEEVKAEMDAKAEAQKK